MKEVFLQWHPAFYADIRINFTEEKEKLIFENELHQHEKLYQAVMNIIVNVNKEIFKEANEIRDIVRILYKEELEEAYAKACETMNEKTRAQERLLILQEFVDDGIITMEQAAKRFGVAVTRLEELFAGLKRK